MTTPDSEAQIPRGPVDVPDLVREFVRGEPHAVWRNQVGGLTFRDGDRFLKWNPHGNGIDLDGERDRLVWARQWHSVPEVLHTGRDEAGQILVTAALAGDGAVTAGWVARPAVAVRAIGLGLRQLHDALPVDACPFGPVRWAASGTPPVDRLVVCQGDACAPNTIIASDGSPAGHVDLGSLGVADRWADLAVASMSLEWNYGIGWEGEFWDGYGIAPHEDLVRAYRQLWEDDD
jgi:kanamycin kinase